MNDKEVRMELLIVVTNISITTNITIITIFYVPRYDTYRYWLRYPIFLHNKTIRNTRTTRWQNFRSRFCFLKNMILLLRFVTTSTTTIVQMVRIKSRMVIILHEVLYVIVGIKFHGHHSPFYDIVLFSHILYS